MGAGASVGVRAMSGRSYLSIGDVLSLLREEFPDVTISKIRFLESQGLVDPERSPSGYRKFYDDDVARLRWVLRKQRDQFLPLKVIRDRLAAAGTGVPPDTEPADGAGLAADAGALADATARADGAAPADGAEVADGVVTGGAEVAGASGRAEVAGASGRAEAEAAGRQGGEGVAPAVAGREGVHAVPGPLVRAGNGTTQPPATAERLGGAVGSGVGAVGSGASGVGQRETASAGVHSATVPEAVAGEGRSASPLPDVVTAAVQGHLGHEGHQERQGVLSAGPPPREQGASYVAHPAQPVGGAEKERPSGVAAGVAGTAPAEPGPPDVAGMLAPSVSSVSLTLAELCAATGLTPEGVASLEGFGLLAPMSVAGGTYYDEEALTVGKLVVEFSRYGVEPRHLRMYRNAADREIGLIEQVITPLLRQRNPEARQRAVHAATDLARLGQAIRASLVRTELRRKLGG